MNMDLYGRTAAERGQALILALAFTIFALPLVMMLLDFSSGGQKAELVHHEQKDLRFVLDAGIANAVDELIRGNDAEGDGLGFLGTGLGTAAGGGIAVLDANGREVGRFRTTVEQDSTDPNLYTLTAVAVQPDFTNPRFVKAAQAQLYLEPGLPFPILGDRNPFTTSGPLGTPSGGSYGVSTGGVPNPKSDYVSINFIDVTHTVPAVNVGTGDGGFYSSFVSTFVGDSLVTVEGGPNTAGGTTPATGADSMTQNDGTLVNADKLAKWHDTIQTYMTNASPGTTDGIGWGSNAGTFSNPDANAYAPTKDVFWLGLEGSSSSFRPTEEGYMLAASSSAGGGGGSKINIGGGVTVTGAGTLIINKEVIIEDGATLIWVGDVIISDSSGQSGLEIGGNGGGSFIVTGNVVLLPTNGKKAHFRLRSDGNAHVIGAYLSLSRYGETEFHMDNSSSGGGAGGAPSFVVDGLFGLLGDQVDFSLSGENTAGPTFTVNGMGAIGLYTGGQGVQKFEFTKAQTTNFNFDNGKLEDAIEGLEEFIDEFEIPDDALEGGSWSRLAYHEPNSWAMLTTQDALISGLAGP